MRTVTATFLGILLCSSLAGAGEAGPPQRVNFSAKPTATRDGDKVKTTFAVSAPTDVAVFVENAQGKIVRHLVAGVLGGQNPPPEPLKPGLSQTVEWDGKADYGKPAEGGPFKVRVALGLGAKYDKVLSSRPLSFAGACALGTGPDGTLYLRHQYMPSVWHHTQIIALNRDGTYRRTLLPFAATADNAEAKGFDVMDVGGRLAPAGRDGGERDVFSGVFGPSYSSLAISPDGKDIYGLAGSAGVMRLAAAGGCPQSPLVAMFEKDKNGLGKEPVFAGNAYAAVSSDGQRLFANGLSNRYAKDALPAVYTLKLPERTGLAVFFGDPKAAGADQAHLGAAPGGLAGDGKGNLLVADTANGRVLVLGEADGKYKGEIKTEAPRGVGVDQRSGAVYVTNDKGATVILRKFSGWQDAKPVGEAQLRRKGWAPNHSMAVDASADPVIIWVSAGGDGQLVRAEDRGGKFETSEISADWRGGQTQECYLGVVVDRNTKEVYARNGGCGGLWERFSDETGKGETVRLPGDAWGTGGGTGFQLIPAPSGNLYGISWEHRFLQLDRGGKPVPWAERRMPSEEELKCYEYAKTASKAAHESYVPVAMGELPHTLGVRWGDGHLFVIEPYLFSKWCGGRTFKALHEYLPTGKRLTAVDNPIIWKLSDAAVGPKFDAAGNIYVAEFVRPKGWYYPPEVKTYLDAKGVTKLEGKAAGFTALYGSILKFSSKGGMVHWPKGGKPDGTNTSNEGAWAGPDPFVGQPKLDPGLKTADAEFYSWGQLRPMKVTGAEWVHPGIGNVGMFRCNCENVTFDVDEFGRTFYPDMCGFRVEVIDTAGNAIAKIGGYGNPENCGPDSPVIDPKTGQPRPRRADDPKDLKSPFAEPEIAVAWPAGVGATDKHLYIGDAVNRRLLRARLIYAAEETCDVK